MSPENLVPNKALRRVCVILYVGMLWVVVWVYVMHECCVCKYNAYVCALGVLCEGVCDVLCVAVVWVCYVWWLSGYVYCVRECVMWIVMRLNMPPHCVCVLCEICIMCYVVGGCAVLFEGMYDVVSCVYVVCCVCVWCMCVCVWCVCVGMLCEVLGEEEKRVYDCGLLCHCSSQLMQHNRVMKTTLCTYYKLADLFIFLVCKKLPGKGSRRQERCHGKYHRLREEDSSQHYYSSSCFCECEQTSPSPSVKHVWDGGSGAATGCKILKTVVMLTNLNFFSWTFTNLLFYESFYIINACQNLRYFVVLFCFCCCCCLLVCNKCTVEGCRWQKHCQSSYRSHFS